MKNQYKIEVGQISLSDSFKQSLKDKMAAEYAAQAITTSSTKKSFNFSKYSKYIATAACLALIIATVGIVSAINGGFRLEKNANQESSFFSGGDAFAMSNDENPNEAVDSAVTTEDQTYIETEEEIEKAVEEDEILEDPVVEEPVEDAVVDMPVPAAEEGETETVLKSDFAPENYDGEYFAEDYVLASSADKTYSVENVIKVQNDTSVTYNTVCDKIISEIPEVGFIKFEITEILPDEDANIAAGDDNFSANNTMYRAELIYDYLTNDSANGEILVAAYGNGLIQQEGIPTFADGDIILACVDPSGKYITLVDQMVYVVHRINGVDIAYHLVYENVDPGYTNMGLLDMESEIVTTTDNNPAIYAHKAAVKELTRYIRRNFEKREFTFANMTSVKQAEQIEQIEQDSEKPIEEEIPVSSEVSVDVSKIKLMIGSQTIDPKGRGTALRSYSNYATDTIIGEQTCSVSFGKNIITFEGTAPYNGNIVSIEINELGNNMMMFTLNNLSIGSSWEYAIGILGLDTTPVDNATVTIAAMSGEEVAYYITVTVEKGVISQILIA